MHTAELAHSDPNFAGLVIRCSDNGPEVLLVFVRPLPPRARPKVTVAGTTYEGSVVSPSAEVLLAGASGAAQTRWPSLSSLSIEVTENEATTKGVVSLEGLDQALGTLNASCLARQ